MSLANAYLSLSGAIDADIVRGERLAHRTSYRIGGPATLLAVCHSPAALRRVLEVCAAQAVPWVVMGKGSNILASDDGFDGCVIVLGREFNHMSLDTEASKIVAGAAVPLARIVSAAMKNSLGGLEFACGIPGTLGGAISMNAGTRTTWIGSCVESVVVLHPQQGLKRLAGRDIAWGYRSSNLPLDNIVLEVELGLRPREQGAIRAEMEQLLARRRATQPMGKPSCGSVFRNPEGSDGAGALIERAGLKGACVGGAQISELHANFIVNNGDARAADVLQLMRLAHDKVREVSGVDLQPEVKFLGFAS